MLNPDKFYCKFYCKHQEVHNYSNHLTCSLYLAGENMILTAKDIQYASPSIYTKMLLTNWV